MRCAHASQRVGPADTRGSRTIDVVALEPDLIDFQGCAPHAAHAATEQVLAAPSRTGLYLEYCAYRRHQRCPK
jgi:hypothetical protein